MNESQNRHAIIVGFFILLGLLFLMGGILMVGNLHETFKRKIELICFFDDINGLQKGANIWFAGVKIGTVGSISIDKNRRISVLLKVERQAEEYIHKDAMVKIGTDGLIGNKVVTIYGGSEKANNIKDGDTLLVETTFSTEKLMNVLKKNNDNLLVITTNFKAISEKLTQNDGTIGKLVNDNALYNNINAISLSLNNASVKAEKLIGSLNDFSSKLNSKGTLANELVTDTLVFSSIKTSSLQLRKMTETANVIMDNLQKASTNPNSTLGVLLYDEESGTHIKKTIKNLESSSEKLDEDLEAAQHSFFLKGYFKKKEKDKKNHQTEEIPTN